MLSASSRTSYSIDQALWRDMSTRVPASAVKQPREAWLLTVRTWAINDSLGSHRHRRLRGDLGLPSVAPGLAAGVRGPGRRHGLALNRSPGPGPRCRCLRLPPCPGRLLGRRRAGRHGSSCRQPLCPQRCRRGASSPGEARAHPGQRILEDLRLRSAPPWCAAGDAACTLRVDMVGDLTAVELDELVPCSAHPRVERDERLFVHRAKAVGLRLGQERSLRPGQRLRCRSSHASNLRCRRQRYVSNSMEATSGRPTGS